jgi:hypothetical protein
MQIQPTSECGAAEAVAGEAAREADRLLAALATVAATPGHIWSHAPAGSSSGAADLHEVCERQLCGTCTGGRVRKGVLPEVCC